MKITVITPSVRADMLPIIKKCLDRQTFKDFEWLVASPQDYGFGTFIQEPPKRTGDYYRLNGAWNQAFKHAQGELIVSIQDGIWFAPDLLEKFWSHYQANPKALIGAIGNQFSDENFLVQVWQDPRQRADLGTFYETLPSEIEYTVCSIPRQAILDVKGLKEEWDKYAALSEKEMNYRMQRKGYTMYLDQSQIYKALRHERLSPDWDARYEAGGVYFQACIHNMLADKDLDGDLSVYL